MNLQQSIPLSDIYDCEEDFSADLADTLEALEVGEFEDVETESNVGTRRADIVAIGEDGTLVVENQFGKADWDHWGRLEAYARLKEATVAALVAEDFEGLMIGTCNRRNEDSTIGWYLIKAQANSHNELFFHHVARPDIVPSEFWAPIRSGELGELFAGSPVLSRSFITKTVCGIVMFLQLWKSRCQITLSFQGPDRMERRDEIMELFPESDYSYKYRDSAKSVSVIFPVLDKGKTDEDDWPEIREKLVTTGTDIYNQINESDL